MDEKEFEKLNVEGAEYSTTFNRTYLARKPWQRQNPGHILSFMPGTVEEIVVKVGSRVKKGETLMVFRAMKMNNNILAPIDGEVRAINVSAGENLPKNKVMIELE